MINSDFPNIPMNRNYIFNYQTTINHQHQRRPCLDTIQHSYQGTEGGDSLLRSFQVAVVPPRRRMGSSWEIPKNGSWTFFGMFETGTYLQLPRVQKKIVLFQKTCFSLKPRFFSQTAIFANPVFFCTSVFWVWFSTYPAKNNWVIVETFEYNVPLFCWFTLLCSYVAIEAIQPSRSGQSDATKNFRIEQNAFGNSCMPFEVKQGAGHRVKRRHVRFVAHSRGGEFQTHVFSWNHHFDMFIENQNIFEVWLNKQKMYYIPGGIFRFPLPCLIAGT